jgi:acyl-CoA synthetase (AMP-forming)/AMP-acid ligase II
MRLIGAWLGSPYYGLPLVLMSPLAFVTRPARWLRTIHKHRGTLTAAPNFAYELCLSKVEDSDIEGLNLGSLRLVLNGAEPVSPNTIRRFAERFAPYGYRRRPWRRSMAWPRRRWAWPFRLQAVVPASIALSTKPLSLTARPFRCRRRVKDIIIRGGRNICPYELEEVVGDIPSIRKGCVAVFSSPDPAFGTERVIVVAETREEETVTLEALQAQIRGVATDLLGMPPDDVVLAPPHTVLKTSSGKIRRAAVRELFQTGRISQHPHAVWWQVTRIALTSLRPRLRSAWRRFTDLAYAVYAQIIFWLLAPPVWLLVALLPGRRDAGGGLAH